MHDGRLDIHFISILLLSHGIVRASGELKFTAQTWTVMKRVVAYTKFDVDCATNDPTSRVSLFLRNNFRDPRGNWINVESSSRFKNRVSKNGQKFTIKVKGGDDKEFVCEATNGKETISLVKGRIIVKFSRGRVKPNIESDTLSIEIETFGSKDITCTTEANDKTLELTWHFQPKGSNNYQGTKKTEIDKGKVVREKPSMTDTNRKFKATLAIVNFTQDDVGRYYCQRQEGIIKTDRMIEILRKPDTVPKVKLTVSREVKKDDSLLKPPRNSNLTIICTFEGSPTPIAFWYKDEKEIKKRCQKISPCAFHVINAQHTQHSGKYTCSAKNLKKTVKVSVIVQVQVPPKVEPIQEEFVYKRGTEVEISLKIEEGNPPPTVSWQWLYQCPKGQMCAKNPWNPVSKQHPGVNEFVTSTYSYMLTTKNVKDRRYRYVVKNVNGNVTKEFKIKRSDNPGSNVQFEMLPTNKSIKITEEQPFEIRCRSDDTIFTKTTLKHNRTITVPTTPTNENGNMRELKYEVKKMNINHTGDYTCRTTSIVADGVGVGPTSRERQVLVSMEALFKPIIKSFDDHTANQVDKNTMMRCDVVGLPRPEIWWKFNDRPVTAKKISKLSECLTMVPGVYPLKEPEGAISICKMKFYLHQGSYTCIANNTRGYATETKMLTILAKPEVNNDTLPETISLSYNEEKMVNCSVRSNPRANVSWIRIDPVDNQTTLVSSSSLLVLTWHPTDTVGSYVCNASNYLGLGNGRPVEVLVAQRVIQKKETWKIIVGVVVTAVVLLLISFVFCWLWMHYFKKTYAKFLEPNKNFQFDPDRSLFEQSIDLPYDVAWEFPRKRIDFQKLLGSGEFGQVWLANAKGIKWFKPRDKSHDAVRRRRIIQGANLCCNFTCGMQDDSDGIKPLVAVKTLKADATENDYKDLASELKILIHLGEHPNIVNVLGACTKEAKLHVLLEYCPHGNLLDFLKTRRTRFEDKWKKEASDMSNEFTLVDLMVIIYQIASGMDFLQSKKCVHRDLAARNVLVGENYIMKIADFGLARDIYKEDVYLKKTAGLLPVKWMAPEALFDRMHTSMSDVWSYAVLLWEVFTLGASPYPSIPPEEIFNFLRAGKRMERPDSCPPAVYTIMLECWESASSKRPMFSDIKQRLKAILGRYFPASSEYINVTFGNDVNRCSIMNATREDGRNLESPLPPASNNSYPLAAFRAEGEASSSSSKEPLLYSNVPTTPLTNSYVTMTSSDHYKTPSTSTHEYVPYTDDQDGGTYV